MSVFLSYRREDSAGHAGRLCEHLGSVFGPENVFLDVQDIAPGQDFAEAIEKTVSACPAVVVVIGPRWAAELKKRGSGEDFVRLEVAAALRRHASVIPVLVGGATMPTAAELPESLAALSRRQAVEIRDARFDDDVKLLVDALRRVGGVAPAAVPVRRRMWVWILLAAIALAAIGGVVFRKRQPPFDINGTWIAEMQKPGRKAFQVQLNFAGEEGRLTGRVQYPTGQGAIQGGTMESDRLTFFTTHTPQFSSEPATIRWAGIVEGEVIRFTETDDYGMAQGIARRKR